MGSGDISSALPPDLRVSAEVADRVRSVISEAEAAASALRHEAEQHAQVRRRTAEHEANELIEEARRRADAMVAERARRISELSDTLLERLESLLARFSRAEEVRAEVEALVDALGTSARALTEELTPGRGEQQPRERTADEQPPAPAAAPVEEAAAEPARRFEPSDDEPPEAEVVELHADGSEAAGEAEAAEEAEATAAHDDEDFLSARLVALQMAVAGGSRGEVGEHLRETFGLGADAETILDDVFGAGSRSEDHVVWPEEPRPRA